VEEPAGFDPIAPHRLPEEFSDITGVTYQDYLISIYLTNKDLNYKIILDLRKKLDYYSQ
jgi:hypothetical protein